ncbi:50S ribosomal protein L21 [Synechococcus sp. H55.7]|uniref:50S ribosomal protein L21 n=1 Tax=unclassified Synechococcus TaxID=2626047 RepID=UPI0039C3C7AB
MTYAIVETSGKQLWVEPGRFYDIDRLPGTEENSPLTLSQVLLINHEGQVTLGHPYIAEAVVRARVLQHRRGNKIIVYKMRPKKKTRKKRGHRQPLTRVLIESIELNGAPLAAAQAASPSTSEMAIAAAGIPEAKE